MVVIKEKRLVLGHLKKGKRGNLQNRYHISGRAISVQLMELLKEELSILRMLRERE